MSRFIHLHTHSHYSLLNALPKIPELVSAAEEDKMPALALTDDGNLYGAIEFYKRCKKADIKPIIGVDFYVATRTRHDKEPKVDSRRHRLVLLAKDNEGYKNLIRLVSRSNKEGFYYKPRIDEELMREYSKGLTAIIPSWSGETSAYLGRKDSEKTLEVLNKYKDIYGNDLYLELSRHLEMDGRRSIENAIVELSNKTGVPLVAAHESFYINPDDRAARETLRSVQIGADSGYRSFDDQEEDFSFKTTAEMIENFRDIPEALENSVKIADSCNLEIELGKWLFPDFEIPQGSTPEKELERIVREGIHRRGLKETPELKERLKFELDTISGKGYAPYFLVVGDLMRFAHKNNILSTIRGSVAGSLVTYLVGITTINPLEYQLPFERFLNPERPSPPDIDMDFADNRRDEVIAYARQKYGEDKVAQIGTFGTMMARGSVRDTARALGYDYATGDMVAKLIPFGSQGFPMTIDKALEQEADLRNLCAKDPDAKRIVEMAKKIEGCARHISVHAAGVVISPIPLDEIVPTQLDTKEGKIITQYDMHSVEDVGLLKFDFLGLKNLAVLSDAIGRTKNLYGKDIDIEKIPLDDKKTFSALSRGETTGVFQLAGGGMTQFLKDLKPTEVHDINAMVALYRPGPMKNIPEYIARKHGKKPIEYFHPKMKDFLERSYGILVYQDDLLSTALEIAGYTWKTVDKFRKAVGKKIPEEMAKQHKIFVQGCIDNSGMTPKEAEDLWNLFEPFQGYGFNKAHAACYGRVAYQTGYMKANFPVAYMASLLTADSGDVEKISEIISECSRMGIEVLSPDINESFADFTVVREENGTESIRFGLTSIKNFGEGITKSIIEERERGGKFASLADFLGRVKDRNLNKKSLEALIKCGALDNLGKRGQMLANIDRLLEFSRAENMKTGNQDSLFGLMQDSSTIPELSLEDAEPVSVEDKLKWEKELLGLYLSGHPLDKFKEKLQEHDWDIQRAKEELQPGMRTRVGGIIEEAKSIITRGGDKMAFLKIMDYTGSIEVVAFPRLYKKWREAFENGSCIDVQGTLSDRGGRMSIIAEQVKKL